MDIPNNMADAMAMDTNYFASKHHEIDNINYNNMFYASKTNELFFY